MLKSPSDLVFQAKQATKEVSIDKAAAEQPLIYNKQFYVQHTMDAELTMAENFDEYVIKVWRASEAYNRFISGNF